MPEKDYTPLELTTAESRKQEATDNWRKSVLNWLVTIACIGVFALKFPSAAQTMLFFILTLGVLVFVHEWGHYQFARWAGMKVNRFGLGFPPWIFTKNYKGIDYSIGALPIGGMVDIAGLGSEEEMVATAKGEDMSTSLSHQAAKPNAPFGEKLFQDSRLGWRFLTLFAGPLMNFIFAIALFIVLFSIWGAPDEDKSKTISVIDTVRSNTPAESAGLQEGDKVVAINGIETDDPARLSQIIRDSNVSFVSVPLTSTQPARVGASARIELGEKKIEPLVFTVVRNGQNIQKTLTPTIQELPLTIDGSVTMKAPAVGIQFAYFIVRKKVSIAEATRRGVLSSVIGSYMIVRFLSRAVTFKLSSEEKRGVTGPVGIAREVGKAARNGFYDLCLIAASISVNLGLMNLLPFPALDGGRILFLGYELVFRKPIDARKESFVHMVGMAMLLAFMLFITVRDILPMIAHSLKGVF